MRNAPPLTRPGAALCAGLLASFATAAPPPTPPAVHVVTTNHEWLAHTDAYEARVSAHGSLYSLRMAGFEFLAPTTNAGGALFVQAGDSALPFTTVQHRPYGLLATNAHVRLEYRFDPTGITFRVRKVNLPDGNLLRLRMNPGLARFKNPVTSAEYDATVEAFGGPLRTIGPNGASLRFDDAQVRRTSNHVEVALGWVTAAEAILRVALAPRALVEDQVSVTASAPRDDFVYASTDPAPLHTVFRQLRTDGPVRGRVELSLRAYLDDTIAATERQTLRLRPGESAALEWTLHDLPPGLYHAELWLEAGGVRGLVASPRFVWRAPELLPPAEPEDFDAFWARTLREQAAIPPDLRLELVRDEGASQISKFSFAGLLGHRAHGWLTTPRDQSRKLPAILQLPSSGMRPFAPLSLPAGDRVGMVLSINTQPVDLPADAYDWATWPAPYLVGGILDRDRYLLRYAYAACVRAAELLAARPDVDPANMLVWGSSQGGGLTLVTAGLYPGFKAAVANVPALCRLDWNLYHLQPPYFPIAFDGPAMQDRIAATLQYFDAAHFAGRIRCPTWVSLGLFDDVTPSMGVFCAFNAIPHPEKHLKVSPYAGHAGGYDPASAQGTWP